MTFEPPAVDWSVTFLKERLSGTERTVSRHVSVMTLIVHASASRPSDRCCGELTGGSSWHRGGGISFQEG
jgi:hypothetical protein